MADDLSGMSEQFEAELARDLAKVRSGTYWTLVNDSWADFASIRTYTHQLPNGWLYLVRTGDDINNPVSITFVPCTMPTDGPYR